MVSAWFTMSGTKTAIIPKNMSTISINDKAELSACGICHRRM
jgi:hypothetical protein